MRQWPRNMQWVRPSLRQSARVGSMAGTAYLAEMVLDQRLAHNRYDDLVLWGGFLTPRRRLQRCIGLVVHYGLSVALTAAYDAVEPNLPAWPGWTTGFLFVQAENALLYPGLPLLNRIHPEVRSGRLPSLLTWRYFWVEIARHAAFGVVLGARSNHGTGAGRARPTP